MSLNTGAFLAKAVEVHYQELQRFVERRTGSPALAEDVLQETWIRASKAGGPLPDNVRAYLFRMVANLTTDHLRRDRSKQRWELASSNPHAGTGESDQDLPEQAANDPADVTLSRQEFAVLSRAVDELPDKCREVFLLYRGLGMTMREVAQQLSISEKTVEKHIARAMLHCRKRMREVGRHV